MTERNTWVRIPEGYITESGLELDVEITVEEAVVHLKTDDGTISLERSELLAAISFAAGDLVAAKK